MEHNNTEIISILSNQLKQGNMVAFLGAGVSRTYINDQTGAVHRGLPASKEIVENLSKKKAYLERDMSFDQALFMVKLKEGRSEVERILEDYINVSTLPPLPAHQLLSDMPFSAFITTNFDRLLESALESSRKKYCSIIEDQDVCRWRSSQIPYIKLHGCITRPQTLIAAEDEYRPIYSSKPIIDSLLKTLLANKVVLFIGFSLHDSDFKEAFQELKNSLGNNMPRSYAIVWDYNEYEFAFWQQIILARLSQRKAAQKELDGFFHSPIARGSLGNTTSSKLSNGPFFPERESLTYSARSITSLSISFLACAEGRAA